MLLERFFVLTDAAKRISDLLADAALDDKLLDGLASSLVWRVGRASDDSPVTVRVGLATHVQMFSDLPKLRNASESEIQEAIKEDNLRVEWVGRMP